MKWGFVIVLLLLLPSIVSAGLIDGTINDTKAGMEDRLHSLDPTDMAAASVADGVDLIMIRTADTLFGFTAGNETNHIGGTTEQIIRYASWTIDPFRYIAVQKVMGVTLVIAIGVLIAYVLLGAAYCNTSKITAGKSAFTHIMDGGNGNTDMSNYGKNVVVGCLTTSLMPFVIYVVLMMSHALKETAMLSIVEMIAPGKSIPLLYLAMAVMWTILSIFFGIANVVILVTGAASFLIGALYASDRTRHISAGWFDYFVSVSMMQVIVVGGVVLVVVTMTEIAHADPVLWALLPIDITMYFGTIVAATYIAYRLTLGKTRILQSSAKLIAMVT